MQAINPMTLTIIGLAVFMVAVEPTMNLFVALMSTRVKQNKTFEELGMSQVLYGWGFFLLSILWSAE